MLTDTCAGALETLLSMAEAITNEPKYFKTRIYRFSFDHHLRWLIEEDELRGK
jgi:hypothetical protein